MSVIYAKGMDAWMDEYSVTVRSCTTLENKNRHSTWVSGKEYFIELEC